MSIQKKKQQAIGSFVEKLQEQERGKFSHVFLFGSLAWGKPDKDSDIDLMIFAKKPRELERKIYDITYDLLLERGETIEPQIYSEREYYQPSSYFVWQALRRGKKIV